MLIAEDNMQIATILKEYAQKEGYETLHAVDGEQAIALFENNQVDVVLLDVMMPKKDGFEVCREIRRGSNVPIIMVTARGEDFEKIMGLDIGADDYIVKPFSPSEVMARVRAILRRLQRDDSNNEKILHLDNLTINTEDYTTTIDGELISLTKKEFEILHTFVTNKNKVFTRDNLLNSLWGYDYFGDTRTVDSHIKRLRAKLEIKEHPSWDIKTIWGVGYKLEVLEDE